MSEMSGELRKLLKSYEALKATKLRLFRELERVKKVANDQEAVIIMLKEELAK